METASHLLIFGSRLPYVKRATLTVAIFSTVSLVLIVNSDLSGFHRSVVHTSIQANTSSPINVSIQLPKEDDVNKTGRYVSMCPIGLFDGRGLGNHLFNFAAMLHVAKLTGRSVAMVQKHPNGWLDAVFNVNITRVDDIERDLCPCHTLDVVPAMIYDRSLATLSSTNMTTDKNILVCGYTQSWKYTVGVDAQLRRHLRPHASLSNAVDSYLHDVLPERWLRDPSVVLERVGIHIRTGNFIKKSMADWGFSIPKKLYFLQAMRHVVESSIFSDHRTRRRRIQFIVITQTIDWCQKWLNLSSIADKLRSPTVDIDLIYSIGKTPQFDFVLLTKSDVTIITAGSFGWWGAWLANKTTIYYRHYPTPGSRFAQQRSKREDYIPANWVPLGGPWFSL